ncbi:MAG: acyl-CoA dehydrogenase [Deltaproteobacteria bacterium]|nr:acyl-CoA dehydrogenase [Deltaproteobacteria bacterium]
MAQQLVDRRDLDFVIWEQMQSESLLKNDLYKEFNKKTCDMIITEARALAIKEMLPTLAEGDKQGIRFDKGAVKVPDCFHDPYKLILEGEWQTLAVSPEMGGQGAPGFVSAACSQYFLAANWALFSYASMGNGTAKLIDLYGTPEQKEKYIPNIIAGKWGGTMLLTESEAGSDVGSLETTAVKNADGTYTLTGNKIFITNGEQDLAENIIHPVLARIEGDPPGTKGISIFIVPKYFVNDDGSLGERNDIICTGAEEKHGIHASATCSMALGSRGKCIGYLLGQPREGMKVMFNMINGARMGVGLQGLSYASAAYLLAVNYARERIQGRRLEDFKDHSAPSAPIIEHPDVRRNLLWMKSYVNGMQSFFHYLSLCATRGVVGETPEEREKYGDLFDMLTPSIKDYLAVKGHEVCIQAIQVYGGAGYCQDYPVEQYARDCKIGSIYEGTSGIQAMDMLARKLGRKEGRVFMSLLEEINKTIAAAKEFEALGSIAEDVRKAANRLAELAMIMGKRAMSPEFKAAFAHSLPFLNVIGDTIMAWMLLWRASVASTQLAGNAKKKDLSFYNGQIKTAEFFAKTILPEVLGKMDAIAAGCPAALEIDNDGFGGL